MKDIHIVPDATTDIVPAILGKTDNPGLILYQHILILLLSSNNGLYRDLLGVSLVQALTGINTPEDGLLEAVGTLSCSLALALLPESLTLHLQEIDASAYNGELFIDVQLTDGSTYKGRLT